MSQSPPSPGDSHYHPLNQPRASAQNTSQAPNQTPGINSVQDHLQAQNEHLNAQAAVMLTQFLSKIRLLLASDIHSDVLCTICSEPFLRGDNPEIPVRLHCGHVFGMNCILKWLSPVSRNGNNSCPNCRKPIFDDWNKLNFPPPQRSAPLAARSGITPALNVRNSSNFPVPQSSAASTPVVSLSAVHTRIPAATVITAEADAVMTSTRGTTASLEAAAPDPHLPLHQQQGTPNPREATEYRRRLLATMNFRETPYVPSPFVQARAVEASSTTRQSERNGALASQSNEEPTRRFGEAEMRFQDATRGSSPGRSREMERTLSAQGSSSMIRQRESDNADSVHNENEPARRLREAKTRLRDAETRLREAETRYDEARTRNIQTTGSFERQVRREYGRTIEARVVVDLAVSAAVRLEADQRRLNLARGRRNQREAGDTSEALPTAQRATQRQPVTPTTAPAPAQTRLPSEDAYIDVATMFAAAEAEHDRQHKVRQAATTNERKRRLWLQFCEDVVRSIERSPSDRTTVAVAVALDIINLAGLDEFITERAAGSPKWQRILRTFPRLHTEMVTRFDDFRPLPSVSVAHCIALERRLADYSAFDVPTLHRARWYTRLSERVAAAMSSEHNIASLTERMADLPGPSSREGAVSGTRTGASASASASERVRTQM